MESSDKKEKKVSEEIQQGSNYRVMESYENLEKSGQTTEMEGDQRSLEWCESEATNSFEPLCPFSSNSKCAKERDSADISLNL